MKTVEEGLYKFNYVEDFTMIKVQKSKIGNKLILTYYQTYNEIQERITTTLGIKIKILN